MITETELRNKIIRRVTETSQADVSRELKISRAYISDVVAGKRRISNRIAKHFGFRITPVNVPIERQYETIV